MKYTAYIVIPLAAFITFLIQPITGKLVLPRYGGDSGSWIISMFYFQGVLLGGYALAYVLVKQSPSTQKRALALFSLIAPLSLRLPLVNLGSSLSPVSLLLTLGASLTLQLLFTTSIGIVLQRWARDASGRVPYHLYAISNIGSLVALVGYPFFIEPYVGLGTQIAVVRVATIALSVGCLIIARAIPDVKTRDAEIAGEKLETKKKVYWLWLSFLNCVLMLGATRVLGAEFGSNPLTWVLPLGLYLASFSLTFSARWGKRANVVALGVVVGALPFYLVYKGVMSAALNGSAILGLIALVAGGSLVANGELYEHRPKGDFTSFYLVIALGGAMGGFFSGLSAPSMFSRNYEFIGSAVLIALTCLLSWLSAKPILLRAAVAGLASGAVVFQIAKQISQENGPQLSTLNLRNHYGHIVLRAENGTLKCASETTMHGAQYLAPESHLLPTAYYAEGSSIGVVVKELQKRSAALHVGVVGLGVGTLATYSRPSDSITFWEINPLMRDVATNAFSFLRESPGAKEIKMMDGRIGVRESSQMFDLLVIDAFSGDSIPLHLITREALQEYSAKVPSGVIAINISNRYIDLYPVLAAHAQALGLVARNILAIPPKATAANQMLSTPSQYVFLSRPELDAVVKETIRSAPSRTGWSYHSFDKSKTLVNWTDSRNSILDVLDLRRAIHGQMTLSSMR